MWLWHCTAVPKKAQTLVVSSQGPHCIIFPIASRVGFFPLYKQSNPTMVMWSLHIFVLGPEKVPPTYFILCNILLTIPKCSKINLWILGFLSSTLTIPLGSSYLVASPRIGTSSIYGRVYLGISSLKIYVTSSWNIGTKFIHPISKVTSLSAPNGVWNVVRSLKCSASTRLSYPTYKSRIPPQCHKLHSDVSPWIMGLFRQSKLHWKALKKTFPMMLGSPWHLKNPLRDQPISSHWTLNCLYLRNQWSWAFAFDCITKLSLRRSHRL